MLAILFLLGASVATASIVGLGMDEGDEEIEDDVMNGHLSETGTGYDDGPDAVDGATGFETLVGDVPSVVSLVSDAPTADPLVSDAPDMETLVSDVPEMVTMFGEEAEGWSEFEGDAPLLPEGDDGDVPADPLEEDFGAPLLPVDGSGVPSGSDGSEALLPEGADTPDVDPSEIDPEAFEAEDAQDWTTSDDPVEIMDFQPGAEILHVTLFAAPDAEAVDVELATSADGLDGEIRANDELLAIVRGVPEISSETVMFELTDHPGTTGDSGDSHGDDDGSEAAGAGDYAGEPVVDGSTNDGPVSKDRTGRAEGPDTSAEGGENARDAGEPVEDNAGGEATGQKGNQGHAYGHDKSGSDGSDDDGEAKNNGRGNAYAYGKTGEDGSHHGKGKGRG